MKMELYQVLTLVFGVIGFVVHGGVMIAVVTWKLASVKQDIFAEIADHREQQQDDIAKLKTEFYTELDRQRHDTAESLMAIRQAVHDNKVEALETFLRADQFMPVFKEFAEKVDETLRGIATDIKNIQIDAAKHSR